MGIPVEDDGQQILICGAGIGGLALAQGLKKANVPFHLFERDPSPHFRPQGYRLKLNPDSCGSLKNVLPAELWQKFEDTCCFSELGETDFNAVNGAITSSRAGAGIFRGPPPMTTDRAVLRSILLSGLDENISFGKEAVGFQNTERGVQVNFTDGTSAMGSLLVGADGLHSSIRKQHLPDHKPLDTGGCCIYGKTPIIPELLQRFPKRALRWMTLCIDQTPVTHTLDGEERPLTLLLEPIRFPKGPYDGQLPQDYVYWVLIARKANFGKTDEEVDRLLKLSCPESAALSLKMTEEWDPSIRTLLELQDISQSSTLRVCSQKPDMAPWEPSDRVTLLGDAIHVMSPCGGVGAATALNDANALATTITGNGINYKTIGLYESDLRTRAKISIERSFAGGKKMFGQKPFSECPTLESLN